MNSSVSTVPITFTIYRTLGLYNFVFVICVFFLYISGLFINIFLVLVICVESRLHRPMYILLVNLALSGVMGSSSVCLNIIGHLIANKQETSVEGCLTQVFFLNLYSGCIFCILALMAYDRYVSICKPLLYNSIMTPAYIKVMLTIIYFILSSSSAIQVILTSRLKLCRHTVDKLLCDSMVIANLSCENTTLISMYGLCCAICLIAVPCFLVILSYAHIFTVIIKTSKESQKKAMHTCIPHLVTFINFSVASFFGVIYNRLGNKVPKAVNILTCLNFFVIPPLLHPVIYGLKMQEIQISINRMLKKRIIEL